MSAGAIQVQQSTIREYAKQLHLPIVGGQFLKLAEEAMQQKQGGVWRKVAIWSGANRSFFWVIPARGKRIWHRGWPWRPAANASG